ncbi:MAG: serine hydrolase [Desulfobulbus sp.]|nr:serine hydrolase [Desulfobulbus sp.]
MRRPILFLLSLLFTVFQSTSAWATQTEAYALGYFWDNQLQRVLNHRTKLAPLLGLTPGTQLEIVGRGQQFGVIWNTNTTLTQANKLAKQQQSVLQRAGLQPAQPVKTSSFFKLYHIRYKQGLRPEDLQADWKAVQSTLVPQTSKRLVIEKINQKNYALVYRCWQSKEAVNRLAKRHAQLLKTSKLVPTLVAAAPHPVVQQALIRNVETSVQVKQPKQHVTAPAASIAAGKVTIKNPTAQQKQGTVISGKMGRFIQEQTQKGRLRPTDRTAWIAFDLSSDTYLVNYNASRSFQAASMIKPFVALAFFHQHAKGLQPYTAQHRRMMEAMIQQSDNPATNWFIRRLGGPARCQALLAKEYGHLFRQVRIREYIPADGRTYKNSALPSDYIQFLRALWQHKLPKSQEILRVMALPKPDRLVCGTSIPNSTAVYNKTGTTALLCGDMGILVARGQNGRKVPYAVVGIVERSSRPGNYRQWMRNSGDAIRNFSSMVYVTMKQKHLLL